MTNDTTASTKIELFLKPKAVSSRKLARDAEGRLLLAEESAIDRDRTRNAGVTIAELGRRVRVFNSDMTKQMASYLVPAELTEFSDGAADLSGVTKTQIGRLLWLDGLYIRHNPGLREVGINDRGDVILRLDLETAEDPTIGPLMSSYNTTQSTLSSRLVARIDKKSHDRDVKEARAWLEAMNVLTGGKTLRARFFSGGVQAEHRGNVPQLYRTTQVNFFQLNDPVNLELAEVLEQRFEGLDRPVPIVRTITVVGIPPNERAYKEFVSQLKEKDENPIKLGLPTRLRDSQFFDTSTKSIAPSCFFYACKLDDIGDSVVTIAINTDYHGEIKSRGIHSGTAAVMSVAEVIGAHASSAILSSSGNCTVFMGGDGSGKSRAATFWTERNIDTRRNELKRRYSLTSDETKATETMKSVGYLAQDDWINLVPAGQNKDGSGNWDTWPTERFFYLRTRGLLSRDLVLSENEAVIENPMADYGADGRREVLGQCTHDYPHERLFYDPDWDIFYCDRDVHKLGLIMLLEDDPDLDFVIRRLRPTQALDFIMKGRAADGSFQPFYNDNCDVSSLLIGQGVTGDRLLDALKAARKGDVAALMNGDEALGAFILDRVERLVLLYKHLLTDIPVYVLNAAEAGPDLLQDMAWYCSENPDSLKPGREKTVVQAVSLMEKEFAVTYDDNGLWSHRGK